MSGEEKRARKVEPSSAFDEIMALRGLRKVKEYAQAVHEGAPQTESPHLIFSGNPGTGKTTVARLFSRMLAEKGICGPKFVATTGHELVTGGPKSLQTVLKRAVPGVLVIEGVGQLDPLNSEAGRLIVHALATACEKHRQAVIVIVTGYPDEIQDKFLAADCGLRARFPNLLQFEDFNQCELKELLVAKTRQLKFEMTDQAALIAARRLAKRSGHKGFANARAVDEMAVHAIRAARARDSASTTVQPEDILGPPIEADSLSALRHVLAMIGLEPLKEFVKYVVALAQTNYELERGGVEVKPADLHGIFVGGPGTGKSSMALVFGRLLGQLRVVSKGECILTRACELIGTAVGGTMANMNKKLDEAVGNILVIDEAHMFATTEFGSEALNVLVDRVQPGNGQDFVVILCGYEHEMTQMLQNSNPGLARRFHLDRPVRFADYTDDQLKTIMLQKAKEKHLELSEEVATAAVRVLAKQRYKPNFGNAAAVDSLLEAAKSRASRRKPVRDAGYIVLDVDDVSPPIAADTAFADIDQLCNNKSILERLRRLENQVLVGKKEGVPLSELLRNWIITGPTGTGKSTLARCLGRVYKFLGLLPDDIVVECNATDLIGSYLGSTAPLVNQRMRQARGCVLFIDEAHGLIPSSANGYAREAIHALVANLTHPDYVGKIVVVMAGYPNEMDTLLKSDRGLRSRFAERLDLPPWEAADCLQLCQQKNPHLPAHLHDEVKAGFQQLSTLTDWASARDAVQVAKLMLSQRAQRCDDQGNAGQCTSEDVEYAFKTIMQGRKPKIEHDPVGTKRTHDEEDVASRKRARTSTAADKLQDRQRRRPLQTLTLHFDDCDVPLRTVFKWLADKPGGNNRIQEHMLGKERLPNGRVNVHAFVRYSQPVNTYWTFRDSSGNMYRPRIESCYKHENETRLLFQENRWTTSFSA